jgi:mono/diheme cytochrome c family protein
MSSSPWKRLVWAVALLASLAPAKAADSARGADIAQRWCANCHVSGAGVAADAGPPFAQIAADPAYTDARLRGWLANPHPPMPQLSLSRAEIEDLIAHIRSLKPR